MVRFDLVTRKLRNGLEVKPKARERQRGCARGHCVVPTERNANNRSGLRESRHPDKISKILRSGHSTPG